MSQSTQSLDVLKLSAYLEQNIDEFEGPITAEKFSGGQSNPTFLITSSNAQYVLRRQPPGALLKSAHAVDREYRVIKALANSDVPVAKAYHLCTDKDVIGSMFYLMSYEQGQIHWAPSFPDLKTSQKRAYFSEQIRVLAAIHSVDIEAVGLADYGRPGNYYERQIGLWTKQFRASATMHLEDMEFLIDWLTETCPADDGSVCLVHGDYRLDNFVFTPEQPQIMAVLDWELSTLGHPLSDLAYLCMSHRMPPDSLMSGFEGLDRSALGVPEESELVAEYCHLRGIKKIDNWAFYVAFSFFRLAAIAQGVAKRALDGNASSQGATEAGKLAPLFASMAVDLINSEKQ